jgi:hypothetical protein
MMMDEGKRKNLFDTAIVFIFVPLEQPTVSSLLMGIGKHGYAPVRNMALLGFGLGGPRALCWLHVIGVSWMCVHGYLLDLRNTL